jgi:hypothetical protein
MAHWWWMLDEMVLMGRFGRSIGGSVRSGGNAH